MSDLNDFKNKNTKFTGTSGVRISTGDTGTRVDEQARLRFNSSTNLMEYYSGTEWKSIDAPPTITSFTVNGGANVTTASFLNESGTITVVISGSLFDNVGATVLFVGNGGGDVSPLTTVRNSTSLITVTVDGSSFSNTFEPYDLKITNGSGLTALLENCILSDSQPSFATAAGSLGTISDGTRSSYTLSSAAATDADGDTITYSVSVGALPTGLSLNSSTGAITGTASAVVSNTTSTFTISAATTNVTSTRQFSITVNAPVIESFTATGPATFSVPVGVSSVDVLVLAGGGTGGSQHGGGGGAGGLIFRPGFPVTPGGTVAVNVGAGGVGVSGTVGPGPSARFGSDTTFGTLTAKGGAAGGAYIDPGQNASPGGSGGGGAANQTPSAAGTGTQPSQPGDSGTYGFGFPGGSGLGHDGGAHPNWVGGGGGGAGGAGTPASGNASGAGGTGRTYNISGSPVGYAGGGGGGAHQVGGGPGATGFGATNGNASAYSQSNSAAANRGGGSGGGGIPGIAGSGGSGVVIVKY